MRDFRVQLDSSLLPAVRRLLLGLLFVALSSPASGRICNVPGDHSTIQAAANDPTCTEIRLTLAVYPESVRILRSLTLRGMTGGPVVIEGLVQVERLDTQVILENLAIQSGCPVTSLIATGRATVRGVDLRVLRSAVLPCPPLPQGLIFSDDFESGDTGAWSRTVP